MAATNGSLTFGILGPLEVRGSGGPLPLGGAKQRALLFLLLLHRGEPVPTERLVDELWGERPPPTGAKTVQVYVAQLRKLLGDGRLITHGHGYRLDIEPGSLDLDRFETHLAEGRELLAAGRPEAARRELSEALALVRGPPLPEFAYEPFAQAEIARLEELQLGAVEARLDAELALGRHAELIPELERLSREHPMRERIHGQLMLALYRAGRQADALEAYRRARRRLVAELGIEPGPALRERERAILAQDPALDTPLGAAAAARRGRAALVAGGVLLAAVTALLAIELVGGDDKPAVAVAANSVAAIDPSTNAIAADVPVGSAPASLSADDDAVWVLHDDDRTITRIDPRRPDVVRTFAATGSPSDVAPAGAALWLRTIPDGIRRLDPRSGVVDARVRVALGGGRAARAPGQRWLVAGDAGLWAVGADQTVSRIAPDLARVVTRVGNVRATSLALDRDGVWVAGRDNAVSFVDASQNAVTRRVPLDAYGLNGVAAGSGAVWATDASSGSLWRIDASSPTPRAIPVGVGAAGVAFGAGSVWVANAMDAVVLRVDPGTNRVVARIPVGGTPREIAFGAGRVWVGVGVGAPATEVAATPGTTRIGGALQAPGCGPVSAGGGPPPDLLVVSDLPMRAGPRASTLPMTQAIEFVLARHRFRAGRFRIGYQPCDDATAEAGGPDPARCAANAQAYASTRKVIGVIGPFNSGCAYAALATLNGAPGGPLAMVSPAASDTALTRLTPDTAPEDLAALYPTGVRNFARVFPTDDRQAAADALLAHRLDLRRVFVLRDAVSDGYGRVLASGFVAARMALGDKVAGAAAWHAGARGYDALVRRVQRARPDGVFLAGVVSNRAGPLIRRLRARLPHARILATDGFASGPALLRAAGTAARGMYVSLGGTPNSALGQTGARFLEQFGPSQVRGVVPSYSAAYAAQAAEVLVSAIERSDGTRASVSRALLRVRIRDGILGDFGFDRFGDTTRPAFTILRVTGGRGASPTALTRQTGTEIDRVLMPPADLPTS